MPNDARVRRSNIILCTEFDCKFKQRHRGISKIAGECALEKSDAVKFYKKYNVTTCEVGMGEVMVDPDFLTNEQIINKLKYKGRV